MDGLVSKFAFTFNLRRYTVVQDVDDPLSWKGVAGTFAVFQRTSNGSRQCLRNRRSNRHMVPLYGKSDCLFTHGLKFETR